MLDAAFVAVEVGQVVFVFGVDDEGAAQEVAFFRLGAGGGVTVGKEFVIPFAGAPAFFTVAVFHGGAIQTLAEYAGLHGEGAIEAPLIGGDAGDEHFLGFADWAEGGVEVIEEREEIFRVLVIEQEVFIGAQAVAEAIAAGGGFAFGSAGAGGFFSILTVGEDAGFGEGARIVGIFRYWYWFHVVHVGSDGRARWPSSP
jgi:hypothetical protein